MDLLKLLRGLEDLVVEIALWIVLLPRTLWRVIVSPVALARYFDQIQATAPADRDDEYLSPVLFWLLLAPVSLVLWLTHDNKAALALYGAQPQEQIATGSLMLLAPPLGFAVASAWIRREQMSRRTLGRHFAMQCYFHAPFACAFVLSFALQPRFGENIATLVLGIALTWFCVAEFRVARRDTAVGLALKFVALGCALAFLLMFAVASIIFYSAVLRGRTPAP